MLDATLMCDEYSSSFNYGSGYERHVIWRIKIDWVDLLEISRDKTDAWGESKLLVVHYV